jgi:hypothetical protein
LNVSQQSRSIPAGSQQRVLEQLRRARLITEQQQQDQEVLKTQTGFHPVERLLKRTGEVTAAADNVRLMIQIMAQRFDDEPVFALVPLLLTRELHKLKMDILGKGDAAANA